MTKIFNVNNAILAAFALPQGTLINGKISVSVASNNLTVAIKGLDGNDPSATNPVYCPVDGTVRSITAALSVTKNAATNWCNAGSAELATKEIDYFVYIGYNATDGVTIGFSRIPFANLYSDFSTTTTNDRYCAISTISNAAASDNYVNVGRFAATLSAGAGYTWTVPTYTGLNLVQRPIYETRLLAFEPSPTGFSAVPNTTNYTYRIDGRTCWVTFVQNPGTSNATTFTATAPISAATSTNAMWGVTHWTTRDNSAYLTTPGRTTIASGASTLTIDKDIAGGAWTGSNTKSASFYMQYEL